MPQDDTLLGKAPTSSHRLPTISGAQALENAVKREKSIPTGLPALDHCLQPFSHSATSPGLRRGQVTEIYGPPGVGRTTFGVQAISNAIKCLDPGSKAIWIDAGSPLVQQRVKDINAKTNADTRKLFRDNFVYRKPPTIAHLLALIMHPTKSFPAPNCAMIVIDNLAQLIISSFPRQHRNKSLLQDKAAQRSANRRFQVIDSITLALKTLAKDRHIAILILSHVTTSLKPGSGQRATLKPALGGDSWNAAISTRILLIRDFCPRKEQAKLTEEELSGYRLAVVVRLGGRDVVRRPIPFVVERDGLRELFTTQTGEPEVTKDIITNELFVKPLHPQQAIPERPAREDNPSQPLAADPDDESKSAPISTPTTILPASQHPDVSQSTSTPENKPTHPQPATTISVSSRPTKRKRTEIADSEDEESDEDEDNNADEDQSSNGQHHNGDEEMLIDEHERQMAALESATQDDGG